MDSNILYLSYHSHTLRPNAECSRGRTEYKRGSSRGLTARGRNRQKTARRCLPAIAPLGWNLPLVVLESSDVFLSKSYGSTCFANRIDTAAMIAVTASSNRQIPANRSSTP